MGWGCYAIVKHFRSGAAPLAALGAVMLVPPFWIDSVHWGQTDSWVLAPMVWMVWAILRRRWIGAGILWGIALGLKPQAILIGPLWLFALLLFRPRKRILLMAPIAGLILLLGSIPFMLHSGMKWFECSYYGNLVVKHNLTTLKAFNIWYVDLLLSGNPDVSQTWWGLSKDLWGKVFLAVALAVGGGLIWRRRNLGEVRLITFAAWLMLAVVIFPTRVHERYILLPLPFLIILGCLFSRLWIPLAGFILAACFQMTSLEWLRVPADAWPEVVKIVNWKYDDLRTMLPPEEFAHLPPPEVQLSQNDRPKFLADRKPYIPLEWTLTISELFIAAILFTMILRLPHFPPLQENRRPVEIPTPTGKRS